MSYILAGDTKVAITSYGVRRHDNKRGLVLTLTTTTDKISLADLDALCEQIRAEKLDILVYNDANELVTTLRGFYHNCIASKDVETGILTAEITNESENTYQIGLLKDRSMHLEDTAMEQAQQVMLLGEANFMQMTTIDSLLLEIIPAVIADAVTVAVADAFASNSVTEGSTPDPIPDEPVTE